jgi:serine/threonine-protein kinase HipA
MKIPAGIPLRASLAFPSGRLPVGRLAMVRGTAMLEYDAAFIASGLSLNPMQPAPASGVIAADNPKLFGGLHSTFADSLPDAWGDLLVRRRAAARGIIYEDLTVLDRLAIVGSRGMGALVYEPETDAPRSAEIDLDVLAAESAEILGGNASDVLDTLADLGGSSGGARPKVLIGANAAGRLVAGTHDLPEGYNSWLVKFRNSNDREDIGPIEAAYADMARAAGLVVSETALLPSKNGPGYFATKRFDRGPRNGRTHFASAATLLNMDYDRDNIGYETLLTLVSRMTRDHRDVEAAYRRMVFNVLARNRDDHAKQHSMLMSSDGVWELGPAYDLTFSPGPGGEHYLTVNGRGRDISYADLLAVANEHHIKAAHDIIDQVAQAVGEFGTFAGRYDVSTQSMAAITQALRSGALFIR